MNAQHSQQDRHNTLKGQEYAANADVDMAGLNADIAQLSALLEPIVSRTFQQVSEEMGDLARPHVNAAKAHLMLDARRLLIERRSQLRASFVRRFAERFKQAHREQEVESRTQRDATLGQHTPFGLARAEDHADLMLPKNMADALRGQYHGYQVLRKQQVGIRPVLPPSWAQWPWLPEILSIAIKDTLSENGFGLNMRLAMLPMINTHLPPAFKAALEQHRAQHAQKTIQVPVGAQNLANSTPEIALRRKASAPSTATNPLLHTLALMQHALSVDAHTGVLYAAMAAKGHQHVLRDLREKGALGLDSQMNARMLELMAMWFDLVLTATDIPNEIKAQLGRLQIPYLRLALQDRSFFTRKTHPARQIIGLIAQAVRAHPASLDVLVRKCESITQRVLAEFNDDSGLFDTLNADLPHFLGALSRPPSEGAEASLQPEYSREQLKVSKKRARRELQTRRPQEPLPEVIDALLSQQLPALLALVNLNSTPHPEDWTQMLAVLDDLVESLTPSRWATDRTAMLAVLPSLLARLDAALKRGGIDQPKRDSLFANLAKCHACAMQGTHDAEATTPDIEFDAELPEALRGEQGAAPVVSKHSPAEPADQFDRLVSGLEPGMRMSFTQSNGEQTLCKLAWVSPRKGVYLFIDGQGKRSLTLNADDLSRRLRFGRATLVESIETQSALMRKQA